jgi:putative permease
MIRANPASIRRVRRLKLASFLSVLIISIIFLLKVGSILASFLLATLIVYLLKPAVNFLERRGFSRPTGIMLIFLFFIAVFAIGAYLLTPLVSEQLSEFQTELPRYREGLNAMMLRLDGKVNRLTRDIYEIRLQELIGPYAQKYVVSYIEQLPGMATQVFTVILLAPFFAFFLLRDGREISRWLLSLVPNNLFETTLSVTNQINDQVGGFIRARMLEALIVGTVVFAGLYIIDFPYAVILAVFAGLTNLIPYIGPIIGAIPALLVAVIDQDGSLTILLVTAVYFFAQLIDMVFIIPLVVARIVNLHPVLVVLAIIAGAELMGILGMIISIPVFSALKLIFSAVYNQLLAQKTDT